MPECTAVLSLVPLVTVEKWYTWPLRRVDIKAEGIAYKSVG